MITFVEQLLSAKIYCIFVFIYLRNIFYNLYFPGNNTLCRYLGSLDGVYNATFASESWREILERGDSAEAATRIQRYVQQSSGQTTVHLPIAEAMLTYKEKR